MALERTAGVCYLFMNVTSRGLTAQRSLRAVICKSPLINGDNATTLDEQDRRDGRGIEGAGQGRAGAERPLCG